MKTRTTITDVTHDDIVTLLSTAFDYSQYFTLDFDDAAYQKALQENDCVEDVCARMLLNGGSIKICDKCAEDENDFNGNLPHSWDDEYGTMDYVVTLKDIVSGLRKCVDGRFKANDDDEIPYMRKCMVHYMCDQYDFDAGEAEDIIQVIVFGNIIYG